MYVVNVGFEVSQVVQETAQMLTFRMTTHKSGVAILVPHVNVFDVVLHVKRTLEFSHTNRRRRAEGIDGGKCSEESVCDILSGAAQRYK